LTQADLLILNGLGMEQWLEKALRNVRPGLTIVEAAAGLGRVPGRRVPDGTPNRIRTSGWIRCWPAAWSRTSCERCKWPIRHRASTYASNAAVCVSELLKLDAEFRKRLAPFRNTPIVTHHDAFDHFARRYELRVVAVIEEVPDVEPTFSHLGAVAKAVRENGVKVIFTEPHHSGRLAQRLAADLKCESFNWTHWRAARCVPPAYEEAMLANLGVLEQSLK
jgi:ABC-type Zn uptake system ZnuABC Zn-binding protein ZnuA